MKKILLVGGAGFIGHNLAMKLIKKYQVKIVDSLSVNNLLSFSGDIGNNNNNFFRSILNERLNLLSKNNIELNIIDSRNYHELSNIFRDFSPDIVIHLAAVSHANKSNKNPHSTFDNSLRTLENSLDSARSVGSHFIYFSSSMVYGNFKANEVNEDTECNPIGIYGTLKYCGELIVKSYNQVFDMPYTIIRPSALYGERCVSRRVGQVFIENILHGDKIVLEGDGSDKLDFTYIEDFIQGIELCCENKNSINQTFNITYGEGRKIRDLVDILEKNFDKVNIDHK
ncbi:NAD(P)-dependent oxidoreductase, partial [Candidatus Pelagibacter sp.]|nr:NAD(P)-dependent oxidoreductase [Candidatus Pelagibacter sp.]